MTYLLDTNACVMYLNGRAPRLRRRLDQCRPDEIVVCSIVKAELFYGAMKSNNPTATLQKQKHFLLPYHSLPFDDAATATYATIRADLERIGAPIGGNDLMIAAIVAPPQRIVLDAFNCRCDTRRPWFPVGW